MTGKGSGVSGDVQLVAWLVQEAQLVALCLMFSLSYSLKGWLGALALFCLALELRLGALFLFSFRVEEALAALPRFSIFYDF
jgi:hypothetical protein